jgi:hypothetical protein
MKISTTLIMAAALATGLACQQAQANNLFGIDVSSYPSPRRLKEITTKTPTS